MRKIRKDDEVIIKSGKYRNKRGVVISVCNQGQRVIVEGINLIKKHVKPNPQQNQTGGIVEKEASVHISNVMLWDGDSKKPSRVGLKKLEDNKKVRIYKKSNEVVK